jgi:hypothetical protein
MSRVPDPALPRVLLSAGGHSFIVFAAGRKWLHAVAMGEPITVVTLPIVNSFDEAQLKGKPYPVRRAARAKTERARRVLRALARGQEALA